MKTITITAYPYATQTGFLEIPEIIDKESEYEYIINHWNDINFSKPELDYRGTDFDINNDEENIDNE